MSFDSFAGELFVNTKFRFIPICRLLFGDFHFLFIITTIANANYCWQSNANNSLDVIVIALVVVAFTVAFSVNCVN